MNLYPVLARELRSTARQPGTYHLRVLGAVVSLVTICVLGVLGSGIPTSTGRRGNEVFATLHVVLLWTTWIIVPLSAADCLSRERREGTLGLLFLTPLRAGEVVLAKSVACGLRAFTLWVAVLPVLMIPLLLGGVGWRETIYSALMIFDSICLGLGAALVASAWSKVWVRAMVAAVALAFLSWLCFLIAAGFCLLIFWSPPPPGAWLQMWWWPIYAGFHVVGCSADWTELFTVVSGKRAVGVAAATGVTALFGLFLAVLIAAWRVRRAWQEEPPSARRVWLEEKLTTPIIGARLLRAWMRFRIERNPVGWLEQRRWTGRVVMWSWLAVVVVVYVAAMGNAWFFLGSFAGLQTTIALSLVAVMAATAAGSFRRERETGVLELLLVSPLPSWRMITGRLIGIWGQFLPAGVLCVAVWAYFSSVATLSSFRGTEGMMPIGFFVSSYLALPVIGLFFSLNSRNFIVALLATLAIGLFIPLIARLALAILVFTSMGPMPFGQSFDFFAHAGMMQVFVACFMAFALWRRLESRSFPLDRPGV